MLIADRIYEFIKRRGEARAVEIKHEFGYSRVFVHRELSKLLKQNRIGKIGTPPKVFYKIPLKTNLKNEADRIADSLIKNYKPEKIILFGSVARNEETKNSDLDIFVVKKTDKNYFKRLREARKYIQTDRQVDLIIYNPQEFQNAISNERVFIKQVLNYGHILYEKGNNLQRTGV